MTGILLLPLAVLVAIVPLVIFLLVIWWLDRYDREPLWLVAGTFGWGAVGAVLLAILGSLVLDTSLSLVLEGNLEEAAGPVIVAPFVEELTKGLILVVLVRHRFFDNATDGFVYGAATGLGFAMTENFLYFSMIAMSGDVGSFFGTLFLRTLFSAPLHAMACGLFGSAMGLAKFQPNRALRYVLPVCGLAAGMLLHLGWNLAAVTGEMTGKVTPMMAGFVGLPLVFVVMFTMFQLSMLHERAVIGRELDDEATHGVLPRSYVPILQSYLRRVRAGWLPPTIPHHHFVSLCTRLAFRKHQLRCTHDEERRYDVEEEVRVLRQELQALIERA